MIAEPKPAIGARHVEREVVDIRRKNTHCVEREAERAGSTQRYRDTLQQSSCAQKKLICSV